MSTDRSRALEEALQRLGMVAPGVEHCAVIHGDGLALAAYPAEASTAPDSAAQLAAAAASITRTAAGALQRLQKGAAGRLLLESAGGTLLHFPLARDAGLGLVLFVASGVNLRQVVFAAEKACTEIEAILSAR